MIGNFTVLQPGFYTIDVIMLSTQVARHVSQSIEFSRDIVVMPLEIEIMQNTSTDIDINNQFTDTWDSMSLSVTRVECLPAELLEVSKNAGVITMNGIQTGEGTLTVYASDSLGQSVVIPGTVRITQNPLEYAPYVAIAVVLLVVTSLFIWRRMRRIPGIFAVTCVADGGGYFTQSGLGPHGTSFSLYTLLKHMNMDRDDSREGPVLRAIEQCKDKLNHEDYRIYLVKKGQQTDYRCGHSRSVLDSQIFKDYNTGLEVKVTFTKKR